MTAEEGGKGMDDAALRLAIGDLNAAYADCIDDDRLEEWPDFFVEDCRYLITDRTSHEAGLRHGIIYAASRGMLLDRVMAMRGANIFEPHHYNHLLGPARIGPGKTPGSVASRCNFQIVRIMEDGRMDLFATGKYLDEIVLESGAAKFRERVVVLDSRNVDILMVVPL